MSNSIPTIPLEMDQSQFWFNANPSRHPYEGLLTHVQGITFPPKQISFRPTFLNSSPHSGLVETVKRIKSFKTRFSQLNPKLTHLFGDIRTPSSGLGIYFGRVVVQGNSLSKPSLTNIIVQDQYAAFCDLDFSSIAAREIGDIGSGDPDGHDDPENPEKTQNISFTIFPGQIIAVFGYLPQSTTTPQLRVVYIANDISRPLSNSIVSFFSFPLVDPVEEISIPKLPPKLQPLETEPKIMVFSGPFAPRASLESKFSECLKQAAMNPPDLLIFIGPFFNSLSPSLKQLADGTLSTTVSFHQLWNKLVKMLKDFHSQFSVKNPNLKVVLIPSIHDLTSYFPLFPTLPYSISGPRLEKEPSQVDPLFQSLMKAASDSAGHQSTAIKPEKYGFDFNSVKNTQTRWIYSLPNPGIFHYAGKTWAVCSLDVVLHMKPYSTKIAFKNGAWVTESPTLQDLYSNIVFQQHFYPMFPTPRSSVDKRMRANFEWNWISALNFSQIPLDCLVISTRFPPANFKISDTFVVNPGSVVTSSQSGYRLDITVGKSLKFNSNQIFKHKIIHLE